MKIYFVRHGESKGNKARIHQSGTTELSSYGFKQAKAVARRFRKISVDAIYSSDYSRAAKTAEAIAIIVQKNINHTPLLRELKRPTEIEGKHILDKSVDHIKHLVKKHAEDPSWHFSDEENLFDFRNRVQQFLEFSLQSNHRSIIAVTHGMFLRMILSVIMIGMEEHIGVYSKIHDALKLNNTGITIVSYEHERWKIASVNDTTHLY